MTLNWRSSVSFLTLSEILYWFTYTAAWIHPAERRPIREEDSWASSPDGNLSQGITSDSSRVAKMQTFHWHLANLLLPKYTSLGTCMKAVGVDENIALLCSRSADFCCWLFLSCLFVNLFATQTSYWFIIWSCKRLRCALLCCSSPSRDKWTENDLLSQYFCLVFW